MMVLIVIAKPVRRLVVAISGPILRFFSSLRGAQRRSTLGVQSQEPTSISMNPSKETENKGLTFLAPRGTILRHSAECLAYRGVEQLEARRAHNPEVVGSSPASATKEVPKITRFSELFFVYRIK